MDTRFLESLVTVADCGSIAEAARRLNLTPAGIAQRVRALESEIGARLLFRSGRSVQPTPAGVAILDRARSFSATCATSNRLPPAASCWGNCASA